MKTMKFYFLSSIAILIGFSGPSRAEAQFVPFEQILFLSGVPSDVKNEILLDFSGLDLIQGSNSSQLHQRVFGPGSLNGQKYREYIAKHTKYVTFENSLHGGAAALAADGKGGMIVTGQFIALRSRMSSIERSIMFMHEARHNEGYGIEVRCPTPFHDRNGNKRVSYYGKIPLEGQYACDDRPDGPNGLEIIVLKNIEKYCDTCPLEQRKLLGKVANDLMERIISPSARKVLMDDLFFPENKLGK